MTDDACYDRGPPFFSISTPQFSELETSPPKIDLEKEICLFFVAG